MKLRILIFFFWSLIFCCSYTYANCIDVEDKLGQIELISFDKVNQEGEKFRIELDMEFVSLLCFNIDFADIMRFYAYNDEGNLVGKVHIVSQESESIDSIIEIDSLEGKYNLQSGLVDLKIVPSDKGPLLELGEIYINDLSIPFKNIAPVYEIMPYEEQIIEKRGAADITYVE
ncbi:MAG: hypothetical protein H6622_01715 [Halobacteriovoraceae bacterium]|nr:hypothetical protein [Halobacteriovoraceae bacterium]